jgi:type IV pilus assembly protein PilA
MLSVETTSKRKGDAEMFNSWFGMHGTRYAARSKGGRAMMRDKKGFTLVELLVVIAIITILAATVVPRVAGWIGRARLARALSEIKNADLSLTKMLADTEKSTFAQFFEWDKDPMTGNPKDLATLIRASTAYSNYNIIFYELLRRGKEAFPIVNAPNVTERPASWIGEWRNLRLKDVIKRKLATTYMDIRNDPWDKPYQFFAGPWPRQQGGDIMYFRCWRGEGYAYNAATKHDEDLKLPGNPAPDNGPGFPAAKDIPVYIFSAGDNAEFDQLPPIGGGNAGFDDVNNWDSTGGWGEFY